MPSIWSSQKLRRLGEFILDLTKICFCNRNKFTFYRKGLNSDRIDRASK